jgi:hypothetical protein
LRGHSMAADTAQGESMNNKLKEHLGRPDPEACPDAYFVHFEDGFGQIQHIAEMLVEATGCANPQRLKSLGGPRAEQIRKSEGFDATLGSYLARKGSSPGLSTGQERFNRQVKAMADHLLQTAQQNNWHVTDKGGVPQQPPKAWGFVELRLVHDLYASTNGRGHRSFVRVLQSAMGSKADLSATDNPESDHVLTSEGTSWFLKPKVIRDEGLTGVVYEVLKKAHQAGKPKPNARQVLDSFRLAKPSGIVRVLEDGCDYSGANGDEKSADLRKIRARILELTSKRVRQKRAAQDPPKAPSAG